MLDTLQEQKLSDQGSESQRALEGLDSVRVHTLES